MENYNSVICPICGNEVTVNLKFKYHKCLYCSCNIKLILKNSKILGVEENIGYRKRETNV